MIVVDTNAVAYLLISGTQTSRAEAVFCKDSVWVAPILWRSEFRNVLALYLRKDLMSVSDAVDLMDKAEIMMQGREHQVSSRRVLGLTARSSCSAYDCEFVVLAEDLGVSLVTSDSKLLKEFPERAVSLREFAEG